MASDVPSRDAPPAVVLLSGGLDSAAAAAIARDQGFALHALSFDYGQRHRAELHAAARVARHLGAASHRVFPLDLRAFGGSALTDQIDVPKDRDESAMGAGVPVTYVPARNTIFLAIALGLAEVLDARDLFLGVNAVDYSGYPDCRPRFIRAFEAMANLATRAAVEGAELRLHTPLIDWPKTRIIERGLELGVDFSLTHSCYDPVIDASLAPDDPAATRPCTRCDACLLRQRAFESLGSRDPLLGPVGEPG